MDSDSSIDKLARLVADGFSELKHELKELRTDLKADIADIRETIVTKTDLSTVAKTWSADVYELKQEDAKLATRISELEERAA